ncbi:MAG: hypothetical protein KFB95_00235 [Simkaniaceae bacterium]|nr:MAG: hypothetical protein KFB95_00235 [Simkaniaceae bacterium]
MHALPLIAARGAFGGLLGQVFSKSLFKAFAEAQIPSLVSATTYAGTYFAVKNLSGTKNTEKEKKWLIHAIGFGAAFFLTPKINHAFFKQKILFNKELTNMQSAALAAGSVVSFFLVQE